MRRNSELSITIGGELSQDNNASLRTIGIVTHNIQLALNRAYLDVKTDGKVQKNERVKTSELSNIDFWLESKKEGSLIINFASTTEWGEKITDRFTKILTPAYNLVSKGVEKEIFTKKDAVDYAKNNLKSQKIEKTISELCANPPKGYSNNYAQKSILRFVNSSLTPVRAKETSGIIGLETVTQKMGTTTFTFNKNYAESLQKLVRQNSFLAPVIYRGEIISTNNKSLTGTFKNLDGIGYEQRLLFNESEGFDIVNAFYVKRREVIFYGMARVESSSLDLAAGDVLFVGLVDA